MSYDYEKLGVFYLGREHDLQSGETLADEVLYESKDLTTHAVCVGMTGSGKTGLCITLLEEAAIDGIPALCIDPKGDLCNLMLTFPGLTAAEFEPWVDAAEAARKGQTPSEYAQRTADLWKRGLGEWNQPVERIQMFRDAAEVAIYTPASNAGRPLTVLKSFNAPPAADLNDSEAMRERIMAAVSGLLALLQIDADPISSREHILLSTIIEASWRQGNDVDMGTLIRSIQTPPFDKVGFLDLESFYPSSDRFKLAVSLNNMLASPGFAAWMEGEPVDIQKLLYTPEGKPRIAIVSIAHLSDSERMFFVTILLNEMLAWMRRQPGTSSLRALLYMDEVFGYFPPTANPPSKQPMLTLLKQARAFGLGCVLATQNPVDIDYKGLSNAGTWFLGRLQTERDKQRVLEGLEGAAAAAGSGFDRQKMEQTLAGLDSRVFLMNNVHEDKPVTFHTRWALSYLRGPLTRQQIETVMEPLKKADAQAGRSVVSTSAAAEAGDKIGGDRPVLPPDITESFIVPAAMPGSGETLIYRPALIGEAKVHFISTSKDIDAWEHVALLQPATETPGADIWSEAEMLNPDEPLDTERTPDPDGRFRDLPRELSQKKMYTRWSTALQNHLYRTHRRTLFSCPTLAETSHADESESDFRIRLRHLAREQRDLNVEKLRQKYASKIASIEEQIRKAEQRVETQKAQKKERTLSTVISVGTSVLGALFGRKLGSVSNVSRAGTAARGMGSIAREAGDVRQAEETVQAYVAKRDAIAAELEEDCQEIKDKYDLDLVEFTTEDIKPRKSDVTVERVELVWVPYILDEDGTATRAS